MTRMKMVAIRVYVDHVLRALLARRKDPFRAKYVPRERIRMKSVPRNVKTVRKGHSLICTAPHIADRFVNKVLMDASHVVQDGAWIPRMVPAKHVRAEV